MSKKRLTLVFSLVFVASVIALISAEHARSAPVDLITILFFGWHIAPSMLIGGFAWFISHRNWPVPWNSAVTVGAGVYSLVHSWIVVQAAFFPRSSTDPIALLVAPFISSGCGYLAGGLVLFVDALRRE